MNLNRTDLYLSGEKPVSEMLQAIRAKQPTCRRIEVNYALDDGKLLDLVAGLDVLRQKPWSEGWNLKGFAVESRDITEVGLATMAAYASRDESMRELGFVAYGMKPGEKLGAITPFINSSSLSELSLLQVRSLPAGFSCFFENLDSSTLRKLTLADCNLDPQSADALTSYLGSPRARSLRHLDLRKNELGLDLIRQIGDTVEQRNLTILSIITFYDQSSSWTKFYKDGPSHFCDATRGYQVEDNRLRTLLERNGRLTLRVKKAALQCLPQARILLNHIPPPKIQSPTKELSKNLETTADDTEIPFRLSDLPREVLSLIVRHTSGDATALSHSQFTRLRIEAEGKAGLRRAVAAADRGKLSTGRSWLGEAKAGSEEEWLESQGLDRWETDYGV